VGELAKLHWGSRQQAQDETPARGKSLVAIQDTSIGRSHMTRVAAVVSRLRFALAQRPCSGGCSAPCGTNTSVWYRAASSCITCGAL